MNKVLRVLLLTVVVLAMVVPLTVSAAGHDKPMLTVSGKIFNGTNGGPETPVAVSLWRDTGAGDVMISESNAKSAMGDFLFQVNCVQGYYTVKVEAFMEGGADAVGMAWYEEYPGAARRLVKKEAGDPGPWTFSFYENCSGHVWGNLVFEYSSVAGPRANAGWMYAAGKVMNMAGAGVPGAHVVVARVGFDETTNVVLPDHILWGQSTTSGDRGFWGMGLTRRPGFYKVWVNNMQVMSANPLWFQVFDVYGSGGWDEAYGPGSAWLPWNFMQADWIYSNLNFMVP
jgi:hypothetical protein